MGYAKIITAYKKGTLDISKLKHKLSQTKFLIGRDRYRAVETVNGYMALSCDISNLLVIPENDKRIDEFTKGLSKALKNDFSMILKSIRECKAWSNMGLNSKNYTLDLFNAKDIDDKFKMLDEMYTKYLEFLELQAVADVRDCLEDAENLSLEQIKKLTFIKEMFNDFKTQNLRKDFFCIDKDFIKILMRFRISKGCVRLDDYFAKKNKSIKETYENLKKFFSEEELRDIIENITLTGKTAKISTDTVIDLFGEISEIELERDYLEEHINTLKELRNKYAKMNQIQEVVDYSPKPNHEEMEKIKLDEQIRKQKDLMEKQKRIKEEAEKRASAKPAKVTIETINAPSQSEFSVNSPRELVIPIVLSWFDKEERSFVRKLGSEEKVEEFFAKIKEYEMDKGANAKLFFITNTGKDETVRRLNEIRRKAKEHGLPKLVEGAFGGYSSFRVDNTGEITDISRMSQENRTKIITLLASGSKGKFQGENVDKNTTEYIRYVFGKKPDDNVSISSLNFNITKLLEDPRVVKQPLVFNPYIENGAFGVDVALKSQTKGFGQLKKYFESKYSNTTASLKIDLNNVDAFINTNKNIDYKD